MAYDFGSQTLGIKNPFKTEGTLRTLGGVLTLLLAVYVVFTVPAIFEANKVKGYTTCGRLYLSRIRYTPYRCGYIAAYALFCGANGAHFTSLQFF